MIETDDGYGGYTLAEVGGDGEQQRREDVTRGGTRREKANNATPKAAQVPQHLCRRGKRRPDLATTIVPSWLAVVYMA